MNAEEKGHFTAEIRGGPCGRSQTKCNSRRTNKRREAIEETVGLPLLPAIEHVAIMFSPDLHEMTQQPGAGSGYPNILRVDSTLSRGSLQPRAQFADPNVAIVQFAQRSLQQS